MGHRGAHPQHQRATQTLGQTCALGKGTSKPRRQPRARRQPQARAASLAPRGAWGTLRGALVWACGGLGVWVVAWSCEGSARGRGRFARGLRGVHFDAGRGGGALRGVRGVNLTLWEVLSLIVLQTNKGPRMGASCCCSCGASCRVCACVEWGRPLAPLAHAVVVGVRQNRPLADPSQTPRKHGKPSDPAGVGSRGSSLLGRLGCLLSLELVEGRVLVGVAAACLDLRGDLGVLQLKHHVEALT